MLTLLFLQTAVTSLPVQLKQFFNQQYTTTTVSETGQQLPLPNHDYYQYTIGEDKLFTMGKYTPKLADVARSYIDLLVLTDFCEEEVVDEDVRTVKKHNGNTKKLPFSLIPMLATEYRFPYFNAAMPLGSSRENGYNLYHDFTACNTTKLSSPPPKSV